ncbi:hypothetical protein TeGR_g3822 [Tetraparma gracilis]|uniref:COMM domain-containing protein n=1 Tax=Tetraparma gracilis TaxID=2962635 RepID=A0ABQ6M7P3_9STRA|nr:hypothetical protein TeGR_g3822 [Tetraparma gracilis]
MRFAIFSDAPPPDWLIVSMASLSSLTSLRMTTLTKAVIAHLLSTTPSSPPTASIPLPSSLSSLSPAEAKAVVSSISFLTCSILRGDPSTGSVSAETVVGELRQLGLQKDLAEAFSRKFEENREALSKWNELTMSYRASRLGEVNWKVFHEVASGSWSSEPAPAPEEPSPDASPLSVFLSLTVERHKQADTVLAMNMNLEQFDTLKMELESVRATMDQLE